MLVSVLMRNTLFAGRLGAMRNNKILEWRYEYDNDVGPNDDYFDEFYTIVDSTGANIARANDESDAKLLCCLPEILKALQWALPLAIIAMEDKRVERIKFGHKDILGKYSNGDFCVGLHQSEVDKIDFAKNAIKKALG